MNAKIISIGIARSPYCFDQQEAYEALGYKSERTWRIFENAGIDKRYSWIDPKRLRYMSFDELCQEYEKGALELSKKAILECLDNRRTESIGSLTFATTTQPRLVCPSMSYLISAGLGLPSDMAHADIIGGGCESSVPAIRRAYDNFLATGRPALVVNAEVCTATIFPARESDLENTVANAIFGDGASAVLVGEDDKPEHPYIVDFESEFDAQYKNYLGYQWLDGRLKVVLHKDVPKIAPILAKRVLDRLLPRNNLDMAHINHLIVHPGGVKVLDNLRDELGIPDEKLAYSREILRVGGNVSSACVGAIGKLVRQKAEIGDYGLVLAMGAGFSTAAMVLFWRGAAGPGLAWPGTARQGEAGLGKARPGAAWPGEARRGGAR